MAEIISTVHIRNFYRLRKRMIIWNLGRGDLRALPYIERLYPSLLLSSLNWFPPDPECWHLWRKYWHGVSHWRYLTMSYCPRCHGNSPFSVWGAVCAAEDFFIGYRETCLGSSEFIKPSIPKLPSGQAFRAYKISKRYDQDISSVIGAYQVGILHNKVQAFEWPSAAWRQRQKEHPHRRPPSLNLGRTVLAV